MCNAFVKLRITICLYKTITSHIPQETTCKSYISSLFLKYGITLYDCSTQKNIDLVQKVQNHAARFITGNFDYINCCANDLIQTLNRYAIHEKIYY